MGTFTFCEVLSSVVRQSRFRLVHEFSWGLRSSVTYKISTYNFQEQWPGFRLSSTSKWCSDVSICHCQIRNVVTMPKHKLEDESDSKQKEKKIDSNTHVKSNSSKQMKKKKKKKKHHQHHKRKHSKQHSTEVKVQKPLLILLDSSSGNESDVCILYDSGMKNKRYKPSTVSKCLSDSKTEESEICAKLESRNNTVEVNATVSHERGQDDPIEFSTHSTFQKVKQISESNCILKDTEFASSRVSITTEDGQTSNHSSNQVISSPSSETTLDGQAYSKQSKNQRFTKKWEFTKLGEAMANGTKDSSGTDRSYLMFNVLSYNVLCQEIMEEHMELYTHNDPVALDWDYRSKLLMKEFVEFNADVMCLQEVQESHLKSFYSELQKMGYKGIFKQRTGFKKDGVAIYFKSSTFQLIDHTSVEYYQPQVPVLNRDNVGLIVTLAPKSKPDERIIVATTHLLYNPKRHDVKLAQLQILLAEIERFAYKEIDESTNTTKYWPVILTGDMNFEPSAGGFQLLNMGWFRYDGLCSTTLTTEYFGYGRILGKELIPPYLGVTDLCQHWNILVKRLQYSADLQLRSNNDNRTQMKLLQIYNSDFNKHRVSPTNTSESLESKDLEKLSTSKKRFASGQLSHSLQLSSVYEHDSKACSSGSQVSTYQNEWVAVDYIFYSNDCNASTGMKQEGKLKLVARYKLLNADQAAARGPIPNLSSPSDHYPLAAKFALLF